MKEDEQNFCFCFAVYCSVVLLFRTDYRTKAMAVSCFGLCDYPGFSWCWMVRCYKVFSKPSCTFETASYFCLQSYVAVFKYSNVVCSITDIANRK